MIPSATLFYITWPPSDGNRRVLLQCIEIYLTCIESNPSFVGSQMHFYVLRHIYNPFMLLIYILSIKNITEEWTQDVLYRAGQNKKGKEEMKREVSFAVRQSLCERTRIFVRRHLDACQIVLVLCGHDMATGVFFSIFGIMTLMGKNWIWWCG